MSFQAQTQVNFGSGQTGQVGPNFGTQSAAAVGSQLSKTASHERQGLNRNFFAFMRADANPNQQPLKTKLEQSFYNVKQDQAWAKNNQQQKQHVVATQVQTPTQTPTQAGTLSSLHSALENWSKLVPGTQDYIVSDAEVADVIANLKQALNIPQDLPVKIAPYSNGSALSMATDKNGNKVVKLQINNKNNKTGYDEESDSFIGLFDNSGNPTDPGSLLA